MQEKKPAVASKCLQTQGLRYFSSEIFSGAFSNRIGRIENSGGRRQIGILAPLNGETLDRVCYYG